MSNTVLTPPAQVLTDLAAAMDAARAAVGELWRCPETELVGLLEGTHRVLAQAHAVHLALVAELTERKIPESVAAIDTRNYLRAKLVLSPAQAGEQAKMATALSGPCRDTGEALGAGRICYEQAHAIVKTLDRLPEASTVEERERAQAFMLGQAGELHARDLRRLRRTLNDVIDPDGVEPREDLARKKRGAFFKDNSDGTQTLAWTDTDENMALAKAAIEALSAPLPAQDGTRDPRCASERRADALLELCTRALRGGDLPATRGVRPHRRLRRAEREQASLRACSRSRAD